MNKIPLIILAGGKSSRMGHPKGLIPFKNTPLLEYQINSFKNAGGEKIILVLGHHTTPYEKSDINLDSINIVINENYELGQFSSIQAGINSALKEEANHFFLLPIDVPAPPKEVWQALENSRDNCASIYKPSYMKKGGHPILISRGFARSVVEFDPSSPNARLDHLIKSLEKSQICYVETPHKEILANINTPSDL